MSFQADNNDFGVDVLIAGHHYISELGHLIQYRKQVRSDNACMQSIAVFYFRPRRNSSAVLERGQADSGAFVLR